MSPGRPEPPAAVDDVFQADAVVVRSNGKLFVALYPKGQNDPIVAGEVRADPWVAALVAALGNLVKRGRP